MRKRTLYDFIGPRTITQNLVTSVRNRIARRSGMWHFHPPVLLDNFPESVFNENDIRRLLSVLTPESIPVAETAIQAWKAANLHKRNGSGFPYLASLDLNSLPDTPFKNSDPHEWFHVPDIAEFPNYAERVNKFPQLENDETESKLATAAGLRLFPFDPSPYLAGKSVVDGGAWIGDTSLILQRSAAGRVYAFEPVPSTFGTLREVCAPYPKIVPIQKGLGSEDGSLTFDGDDACAHAAETGVSVPITTIDHFFKEAGETCGLIKLDVEGLESDVVTGALETIRRDRPLLLISVYHTPKDFFEIAPRIAGLNLGYRLALCPGHRTHLCTELCLVGYCG